MHKENPQAQHTADNGNDFIADVSMSYGFQIGSHIFEIQAKSEKEAMLILVKEYWEWIDKIGKVELLGGREK